jgi:hypothetical protein
LHATQLQFLRRKPKDWAELPAEAAQATAGTVGMWLATAKRHWLEETIVHPVAANLLSTAEVRSPAGEHVGKIVDFMLDTERGSVEYAVLAVGGVLGVGAKMLAVQPGDLRFDAARRCLEITVDTATLADLPGIDRANPPDNAAAAARLRASSGSLQSAPRSER